MAGNGCLAGAREAYKKKVLAEYAELEERLKKKVTTNDRWKRAPARSLTRRMIGTIP